MFQIGGTDIHIHKYLGPKNPSEEDATADMPRYDQIKETNIQDLLFLENRDRTYDDSIYRVRGIYNVADLDFNLSQFGLFIDNDVVFMTVHINDFIRTVGRKPMNGDVIEIPHLKDEFALNEYDVSLPRYYVISDVGRAAEGFSPTWYPHLYRLKLTKMTGSQQYQDILDKPVNDDSDLTLKEILSTANISLKVNDILLEQAELDAPLSGYDTQHLYTLAVDDSGNIALQTVDTVDFDASVSGTGITAASLFARPVRSGYAGYLLGDGIPENGATFGFGVTFPEGAIEGDYFLRKDFLPNRLFRFDGVRWVKKEDAVRTSMTPSSTRNTQKGTFINNPYKTGVNLIVKDIGAIVDTVIETTVPYTAQLYAEVAVREVPYAAAKVINNNGVASIELPDDFAMGDAVSWRLYESSFDERQALSKALKRKPQANV